MLQSELNKCRTCLKSQTKFQLLDERMNLKFIQITYMEALIALTNISFKKGQEDRMPQRICTNCTRKLREAQEFIKQAQDANSILLSHMKDIEQPPIQQVDCLKQPPFDMNESNNNVHVKIEAENDNSSEYTDDASTNYFNIKLEQTDDDDEQEFLDCSNDYSVEDSKENITSGWDSTLEGYRKTEILSNVNVEGNVSLPFHCEKCKKTFKNAAKLNRHKRETHIPDELKTPCPNCGRKFNQRHNMYAHMRAIHSEEFFNNLLQKPHSFNANQKYQCVECRRNYTSKRGLQRHIKNKHGTARKETRTHVCTLCGLATYCQSALELHMRRHTGEKPFKCNMCDKAFVTRSGMKLHYRTHTGEKPYVCRICSKAFQRSTQLRNHLRTHAYDSSNISSVTDVLIH